MNLFEVYLLSGEKLVFCLKKLGTAVTYNSSMVSWGGSGSSSPRPIISHVNVWSSIPTLPKLGPKPMPSIGACGDPPFNPQFSDSMPLTFRGLLSSEATGRRLGSILAVGSLICTTSGLDASWDLSCRSTSSTIHRQSYEPLVRSRYRDY